VSTNTLSAVLNLTGLETLDEADFPAGASAVDRTLRLGGLSFAGELSATTEPALEATAVQINLTIGASPTTIDLTVIDIGIGRTADMTGKRLIAWGALASASNAGKITIKPAAAAGYEIFGTSTGEYNVQVGEIITSMVSGAPGQRDQVGASNNYVTISGTEADTMLLGLWFGN